MSEENLILTERLAILEKEFKEIKKSKPWYKEVSTLVAVAALLFSFSTTFVSYVRTSYQDYLTSRVELRALIKDLSNIPSEYADIAQKYGAKPEIMYQLSSQINTTNLVLSKQAISVISRIENNYFGKGTVPAVDYLAVGTALNNSFEYSKAEEYFEKALIKAVDPATAVAALRARSSIAMVKGDMDEMRQYMSKASEIFKMEKYSKEPPIIKNYTNANTYLQWANAELMFKECSKAKSNINLAANYVERIPSQMKNELFTQLLDISNKISVCSQYKANLKDMP